MVHVRCLQLDYRTNTGAPVLQIVSICKTNAVHMAHFNLCLSSASTMQMVYSLWELCLSQKY